MQAQSVKIAQCVAVALVVILTAMILGACGNSHAPQCQCDFSGFNSCGCSHAPQCSCDKDKDTQTESVAVMQFQFVNAFDTLNLVSYFNIELVGVVDIPLADFSADLLFDLSLVGSHDINNTKSNIPNLTNGQTVCYVQNSFGFLPNGDFGELTTYYKATVNFAVYWVNLKTLGDGVFEYTFGGQTWQVACKEYSIKYFSV